MSCTNTRSLTLFQPTLPSAERSDRTTCRASRCTNCFNPRSPRQRGATPGAAWWWPPPPSFNPRSPRQRGATGGEERARRPVMFQPTLPSAERSDSPWRAVPAPPSCFNPRSPRQRGATQGHAPATDVERVSTHAPLGREERPRASAASGRRTGFNPRSPRQRGATWPSPSSRLLTRFQPTLPSAERSDELAQHGMQDRDEVSTHAPLGREERLPCAAYPKHFRLFQPTLPSAERSDASSKKVESLPALFQPTLPSAERSDVGRLLHTRGPHGVSTHAPLGREERRRPPRRGLVHHRVSTHAPLSREERLDSSWRSGM